MAKSAKRRVSFIIRPLIGYGCVVLSFFLGMVTGLYLFGMDGRGPSIQAIVFTAGLICTAGFLLRRVAGFRVAELLMSLILVEVLIVCIVSFYAYTGEFFDPFLWDWVLEASLPVVLPYLLGIVTAILLPSGKMRYF